MKLVLGRIKVSTKPLDNHTLASVAESVKLPRGAAPGSLINIDVVGGAAGAVELDETYRNIVTRNLYSLMFGLLTNSNYSAIDITGDAKSLRILGRLPGDIVRIADGTACTPETFADLNLASRTDLTTSLSFGFMSDRMRISAAATTSKAGCELGLISRFYDTGGALPSFLLARRVIPGGFSSGSLVAYYIDFFQPWLRNFGLIMWGYFSNTNPSGLFTVDGTSYTARTATDRVPSSAMVLAVGTSSASFSFDTINLTNRADLTTYLSHMITPTTAILVAQGWFVPTAEYTIRELGIVQDLFDSGGTVRKTLLARIVLPTAVIAPANKLTLVSLRWLAY